MYEDLTDGMFDIDDHFTYETLRWIKTVKVAPKEVPDLVLAEKLVKMKSRFKISAGPDFSTLENSLYFTLTS